MAGTYIDPVCGMEVTSDTAEDTVEYQGRTYYFCSADCRETFEANPEKYAQQTQERPS